MLRKWLRFGFPLWFLCTVLSISAQGKDHVLENWQMMLYAAALFVLSWWANRHWAAHLLKEKHPGPGFLYGISAPLLVSGSVIALALCLWNFTHPELVPAFLVFPFAWVSGQTLAYSRAVS